MSSSITSYATEHQLEFPFVTVPNFELLGSHLRATSGSHIVHWMPFVTDDERSAWEHYAMQERFHIDASFDKDAQYRRLQDEEFWFIRE